MREPRVIATIANPSTPSVSALAESIQAVDGPLDRLDLIGPRSTVLSMLADGLDNAADITVVPVSDTHQAHAEPSTAANHLPIADGSGAKAAVDHGTRIDDRQRRLRETFATFLDRTTGNGTDWLTLRFRTPALSGCYRYLPTGHGGGSHVFTGLSAAMRTAIGQCATAEGLDIDIDDGRVLSVAFPDRSVDDDLAFLAQVLESVYNTSLNDTEIIDVVIAGERRRIRFE